MALQLANKTMKPVFVSREKIARFEEIKETVPADVYVGGDGSIYLIEKDCIRREESFLSLDGTKFLEKILRGEI